MKPMQYMHYTPSIYTALANPLCVRVMLLFVKRRARLNYAQFVWEVIDHMHEPEFYWYQLRKKHFLPTDFRYPHAPFENNFIATWR